MREWVAARSGAFWVVAGLSLLAAGLRFATLGVQSYHHDEIVTAVRVLHGGFGDAMNAVNYSESAPPLYYALAWVWTQLTGTGEFGLRALSALAGVATVPVAYLIGARAARPPRRDRRRGAGRGQPDAALVLAGGARLRALRASSRRSRRSTSSARSTAAAAPTCSAGESSRPWRSPPITSPSSRSRSRRSGCCAAAVGDSLPGWRSSSSSAWRWRRWRSTRPRSATPNGSPTSRSATGSGRRRRPSWPARPAKSSPGPRARWPALAPFLLAVGGAAPGLARGERDERRAAAIPLVLAGGHGRAADRARDPRAEQGLRPRPQPDARPGAAAGRGRDRRDAARRPSRRRDPRRRRCSPTRSSSASSPASRRPCSAPTGTPSPTASARRARRGRSSPGPSGQAPLHHYLAGQLLPGLLRRTLPVAGPRGRFRLRRAGAAGPGEPARARASARSPTNRLDVCTSGATRFPGPDLARLRLRTVRDADLGFRSNGALVDGVGPG